MPGNFTIDGSPVNDYAVWRHAVRPGRVARGRVYAFAGSTSKYVMQGPRRPGQVVVVGRIEAASLDALPAALEALEAYTDDGLAHDLAISGVPFTNCACVSVRPTGDHQPEKDGDVITFRRPVVLLWERLDQGGVT
ncbi:MAG: hypothetical protein AAFY08_16165 [Planctomycetota bacterium]